MSFEAYFFAITLFSTVLYANFLWLTRKIQFPFPEGEDSLSMVHIAAQSPSWRWPSQLLRPDALGTYLKVMNVFLLVIFQKIFRDKKNMFPLVALWGLASVISSIFVFLIVADYFNPLIGLVVSLLFITSFWPWQTALNMGHINVATMFFLAGVYASTYILTPAGNVSLVWLATTGFLFACLFFSSSSAIKYFPFAFAALIFAKYRLALEHKGLPETIGSILTPHGEALLAYVVAPIALIIAIIFALFYYKRLITQMYAGDTPSWLLHILSFFHLDMAGKAQFTLKHYLAHARYKIRRAGVWIFRIYLFWAFILYPLGLNFVLPFLSGFLAVVLVFTLPDVKRGLSFYWRYLRNTQIRQKTAFRGWEEYFAAKGIAVDRYFTAGIAWLPKFFTKFIPEPIFIFYALAIFVVISQFAAHDGQGVTNTAVILFISLLPCIWGEMTNSPKLGRVYLPAYLGLLLFIGYALNQINIAIFSRFSPVIFMILIGIFTWNIWKFFTDIFPSRMAVSNLLKALDARGIKEFYTYRTDYNLHFVGTIRPELRGKYTIHYIDSLTEVKDGWIVIPGMSIKTAFWITDEMRSGVDFIKDPLYNKLLATKKIEQVAAVKLKTFSSSRFWIMDSEITSFHDLILHDITADDFFRGHGWLLHSRNLPTEIVLKPLSVAIPDF